MSEVAPSQRKLSGIAPLPPNPHPPEVAKNPTAVNAVARSRMLRGRRASSQLTKKLRELEVSKEAVDRRSSEEVIENQPPRRPPPPEMAKGPSAVNAVARSRTLRGRRASSQLSKKVKDMDRKPGEASTRGVPASVREGGVAPSTRPEPICEAPPASAPAAPTSSVVSASGQSPPRAATNNNSSNPNSFKQVACVARNPSAVNAVARSRVLRGRRASGQLAKKLRELSDAGAQ
mmetsp:Transcript_8756/g.21006  ORF Transcript_8756/g.21006 Transcript_8756/m.21006 type:complete len:233 (-) Transcript_8756:443-1141(-)